jgi:hypothetical protein
MVAYRTWCQGETYGTLHTVNRLLLLLFLSNGHDAYSPFHGIHIDGGIDHTGDMCSGKYMVEDFHAYRRHRRCGRGIDSILNIIYIQSHLVALSCYSISRNGGNEQDYIASA